MDIWKRVGKAGLGLAVLAGALLPGAPAAAAEDYRAVPAAISGASPDGLGQWNVDYQRVEGGDPAVVAAINDIIDAEARGQVATYEPSATKTQPWTFHSTGTPFFGPITVSELFVGEYNTDMPNMPFHAVATRVFDKRSGVLITWDNLFTDKKAGLVRLADQTVAILPTVYAPPKHPGTWQFGNEVAPIDVNFKYWIPTDAGIELHFPDYQFGRGLAVITVPWAAVAGLIAPEFAPIMG
ncbi:DUF3298 domain-containing protein [Mycobacterium sp. 1274756.6]|uniref:DUF3298 domain-containing protein n=1 Tax=Mycobacterium sp. 1274756.6 TaxID=1834076 RepID=UPI000ABC13DA|nr:DUF3298 domain-containing protein [Mycobacterium sp. 1274756.6]